MKMTVLEMTQDILNDIDGDYVDSINDSEESLQVAQIVKTTYYAMISNREWSHLRKMIRLDNQSNVLRPTHLTLPSYVTKLITLNYDVARLGETKRNYKEMIYLAPDEFLRRSNNLDSDREDVMVAIDPSGVELLIHTDKDPQYYTSFDETSIVFDGYRSSETTTLRNSDCQAYAYVTPEWKTEDNFIPELPEEAFIALVEKAKARAALKLTGNRDIYSEQEATRQDNWLSRNEWRVKGGIQYPNYGRHR